MLARDAVCVHPDTPLEKIIDSYFKDKRLSTIPVVGDDNTPVGQARRKVLVDIFVNPYGRSLYGKKPIKTFMDEAPMLVEKSLSVEEASQQITSMNNYEIEDDFIVTDNGEYAGMGKVVELLKMITELQIRNARYANPLTLLPGNVPIYEQIENWMNLKKNFVVAYCDLDNFKPYNDVYGYDKGDEVLKKVAEILAENIDGQEDFIGHVGGDDFIIICTSENWHSNV